MRDRGEVDDRSDAVDERAAIELGGDIGDEDLMQLGRNGARRDEAPYRGADRVSAREQLAAQGGADEARRTGDENAHVRTAGRSAAFPIGAIPDSSKPLSAGSGCHYNTRFIETQGRASDDFLLPRDSLRDRKSTRLNSSHLGIS